MIIGKNSWTSIDVLYKSDQIRRTDPFQISMEGQYQWGAQRPDSDGNMSINPENRDTALFQVQNEQESHTERFLVRNGNLEVQNNRLDIYGGIGGEDYVLVGTPIWGTFIEVLNHNSNIIDIPNAAPSYFDDDTYEAIPIVCIQPGQARITIQLKNPSSYVLDQKEVTINCHEGWKER